MASTVVKQLGKLLQKRFYSVVAKPLSQEKNVYLPPQEPKITRLPSGLAIASVETYAPISRVAFVANAGTRFETGDNLGITHCLRLASGLSTNDSTGFSITRRLEHHGCEFVCSTTREYMIFEINGLRKDFLALAMGILQQLTASPAFRPWELKTLEERMRLDIQLFRSQPNIYVYDLLHQAAFRDTLGRSPFAPEYAVGSFQYEQLKHFMKTYFSAGRVALVGVGVDHDELIDHAKQFAPFVSAGVATDEAKYGGGEIRVDTGGVMTYAAMVVEGASLRSPDMLSAAVLQQVLGSGPTIKYSLGTASSLLGKAVVQATSQPSAVTSINANYSDSGLFGLYAIAPHTEIEKVLRSAHSHYHSVLKDGLKERDVSIAKQRVKADIAFSKETTDVQLLDLAEQSLTGDQIMTAGDWSNAVDTVTASDVNAVAKQLLSGKLSMAAVGNLSRTPYLDSFR